MLSTDFYFFLESASCFDLYLINSENMCKKSAIYFIFILGVNRRSSKNIYQTQPQQSASNNSKQLLATGIDTARSSSARVSRR